MIPPHTDFARRGIIVETRIRVAETAHGRWTADSIWEEAFASLHGLHGEVSSH